MIDTWDIPVPFVLQTPQGLLYLNTVISSRYVYVLLREGSTVNRPLRVTVDQIPQGDGTILHRRFTQGYQVTLQVLPCVTSDGSLSAGSLSPACDDDLVYMTDLFMRHVNATLNADDARLIWTPPGNDPRMYINLRWLEYPGQETQEVGVALTVSFDTPFPYAISELQQEIALGGAVTNNGSADFYPVLHIDGPSTAFIVANDTLGLGIVYDSSRPGGRVIAADEYVEIDCFRNTIVLNGDELDVDASVDPLLSTFFWIEPGESFTEITGATGFILMNDAFA